MVAQSAVIGVRQPRWGEAIHAVLHRSPGSVLSEESLLEFASERLTAYKKPRSIEFVEVLPLSATGKILKNELRKERLAGADS